MDGTFYDLGVNLVVGDNSAGGRRTIVMTMRLRNCDAAVGTANAAKNSHLLPENMIFPRIEYCEDPLGGSDFLFNSE